MPRSIALVLVHIIFSTKNRMPFLQSAELRLEVQAYLTGTLRGLECDPLQVGGVEDHVHRKINFRDEFRALLNKHEIRFEERYVWD